MITTLFLVAVARQDVTFEHKAAPVPVVVKALSEAVGQPLHADGSLNLDYVVVRFDNTPLEVVKERLGQILVATWRDTPEGPTLGRTSAQQAQLRSEYVKSTAERIREGLAKLAETEPPPTASLREAVREVERLRETPNRWQRVQELNRLAPSHRLAVALAKDIDWTTIPEIVEFLPIEFMLNPTRLQRPLGRNTGRLIAQYNREAETHRKIVREELAAGQFWWDPIARTSQEIGPNDRIGLVVRPAIGNIMIELVGLDQPVMVNPPMAEYTSATPIEGLDGEYELSEQSQEFERVLKSRSNPGTEPIMMRDLLRLPEVEPLAWLPSDMLLGVAKTQGKDLIAVLPDFSSISFGAAPRGSQSVGQALAMLDMFMPLRITTDPFLSIASKNLAADHDWRCDREALGKFLRVADEKEPMLGDYADLCKGLKGQGDGFMAFMLMSLVMGDSSPSSVLENLLLLKAFAVLTPGQRREAQGPKGATVSLPVSVPQLPAPFRDLIFRSRALLLPLNELSEPSELEGPAMKSRILSTGREWFERSATTVYGNGLPPTSKLVFQVENVERVVADWGPRGSYLQRPMSPEELGRQMVLTARFQTNSAPPTKFAVVTVERLTISAYLGQEAAMQWIADLGGRADPEKMVPLDQLPEAVRKAIDNELAKAKDMAPSSDKPRTGPP